MSKHIGVDSPIGFLLYLQSDQRIGVKVDHDSFERALCEEIVGLLIDSFASEAKGVHPEGPLHQCPAVHKMTADQL